MIITLVDEAKGKLNLQDLEQQIKEIVEHFGYIVDSSECDQVSVLAEGGDSYVSESYTTL